MIRCDHCHAETSNGLLLCDLCQRQADTCLQYLPVYFRNLTRQRRPGRPNGTLGSAGQWILRRGEEDISLVRPALDRAANKLAEWALKLELPTPDADTDADTVSELCETLAQNIARIAARDDAGRFVRDVVRHERVLCDLTESIVPGWYAGTCRQPSGRDMEGNQHVCGATIYVIPGLNWSTCARCGATTHASAHLDTILEEATDWTAPPMRLAEAIVALVDTEHDVTRLYERIKKWSQRGHITAHRDVNRDGEPYGPNRYRLGDVLELLTRDGATRLVERRFIPRVG